MPNMSYCRFQNTLNDLRDCKEALDTNEEISEEERKACLLLIDLCGDIYHEYSSDNDKCE